MTGFIQDLRYCLRMLRKHPSFTIVAVATLALGIGASTAIFSIANVVILNPFPYHDPGQLFFVRQSLPKIAVADQLRASGPEFVDLAQSQIFERVAAIENVSRNLTGSEEPERVAAAKVSTEFFTMLGVEPILGRTIRPEEQGPNGERVLVIGYALWQRRFGGDRSVLGQKVALDDEPFTIVGVMPPSFRFNGDEAWFPCPFDFGQAQRSARAFGILVRTKPGTSITQTNAQLETLARRQEQAYVGATPEYQGRGFHLQSLSEFYFGIMRKALLILLGAVALVLLIACRGCAQADSGPIHAAGFGRYCDRVACGICIDAADDKFAVRRDSDRCAYIRHCRSRIAGRRAVGLLPARATGDEGRSVGGAALRIGIRSLDSGSADILSAAARALNLHPS